MDIKDINPFVRHAEIQPHIIEGVGFRKAYDHRLFYVLDGTGKFLTEKAVYEIRPNTLMILPPETPYYFRGDLHVVVINYDITRNCDHKCKPICPPIVKDFDKSLCFDLEVANGFTDTVVFQGDEQTRDSVLKIVRDRNFISEYSDSVSSGDIKVLLATLLMRINKDFDADTLLINNIIGYIKSNAAEIKSNEDISRHFNYNTAYIGNLVKQKTGVSLHKIIMSEKIQYAERWMLQTNHSISDIAELAGFSSRSHFCSTYKKIRNMTPLEYKAKIRK